MDNEVNVSVIIKTSDMYDFLLHHAYRGFSGMIGIFLSFGAIVLLITGYGGDSQMQKALLLVIALLFTVINPIQLYMKAAKQVKLTPGFKLPLDYKLNNSGIQVSQGGEAYEKPWEEVRKVIETGKSIIIYMSNVGAYLLPKSSLVDHYEEVKNLINLHVDKKSSKLK
ncbi:MAG: hypothetical protein K0S41_3728 [Anaerocolumna sp.]|nr:hypothetical protein [Anaerocolumna sp.]